MGGSKCIVAFIEHAPFFEVHLALLCRYNFLCKQEKRGDLRKDARMMECASLINRLLTKDSEGRRRNLHLRTFTVIILKEDCGLLQWVPNTTGLRNEVTKAYTSCGLPNPMITTRTIRPEFEDMQMTDADDTIKAAAFRSNFAPRFPAVFHKWFLSSYADPTAWFEARLAFTRSAAVWSMVGHIVGLGDRHGENILLDKSTGECVHVDFDCLFDKGMSLTRPEIVPFRLTANMLDAMGLCGYEGVFRRVSEATMAVLRGNKDMLLSVLESFIHDPLVEWAGKQKPAPAATGPDVHSTLAGAEKENKDGLRMVKRISERLDGFYNIGPEAMSSKPGWKSSRANNAGHRRFGASALSIEGQVHRLIKEATNDENLALMYIGWMPFL
jgi:serine/threonine-protein kinase ATR